MRNLVWMLLGTIVAILGFQNVASACTPPMRPPNFKIASSSDGTEFGFAAEGNLLADLTARLYQGETVFTGSLQDREEGVYVFVPDEAVGTGEYTLTLETVFEEYSRPVTVLEFPEFEIDIRHETAISESREGSTCCSTQSGSCNDSCGSCLSCWPKAYQYSRTLALEFTSSQPAIISVLSASESNSGGTVLALFEAGDRVEHNFLELDDSQACALITARSLSGEELYQTELCVPALEFPTFERRSPDEPEAVVQCAEPPDDTNDANWKRYRGDSKVSSCATGTGGVAGWLILLVVGFRRRLVTNRV